ncbi:MAG TPA: hypothetical protein VK506_08950 [Conexibacter sp.]|nr:hypothetical protein [Conexibacter sp.]
MRSPSIARAALALLAASNAAIGLLAWLAPRTFYDDFPFVGHWVDRLPPYNQHLVTDVGAFYLAFAVVIGWAAWTLQRELVRAACVAWIVFSILHLGFHATHLDGFGAGDAAAELLSLAAVVALPLVALWAIRAPAGTAGTRRSRG